jgi:NADH-quinone oxidoreductase subunit E
MGLADIAIGAEEFISAGFSGNPDELISLLQFLQKNDGYISPQGAEKVARFLGISAARVYTVASFYAQFRFHQPGENHVRVCLGTACHVQGGGELSQEAQEILHIRAGETSPDRRFDLEEVACLGCCAQAAVVEFNGKIYAKMSRDRLREVLEEHVQA